MGSHQWGSGDPAQLTGRESGASSLLPGGVGGRTGLLEQPESLPRQSHVTWGDGVRSLQMGGDAGEASVGRSWVDSQLNCSPDAWVVSCPGPTFLERPFHSSGTRGVVGEGVGGRLVDGMERPMGPGGGVAPTATDKFDPGDKCRRY